MRLTCIPVVIGLCPAYEKQLCSTLKQLFSLFFALLDLNGWSVAAVVGGNTGGPEVGSHQCVYSVNGVGGWGGVKCLEGKTAGNTARP